MKKIVVLNSGGFDSTTLLVDLSTNEELEIHSLYFNYGQPNKDIDSEIAKENAEKVGAIHHEIYLPRILWSKNTFYNSEVNEYQSQYLEMRNMIFISYAMSLAESIGATSIYMALLKGHGYTDTSEQFINAVRELCKVIKVSFETPFSNNEKQDLFFLAKSLGVGREYRFISCDTPVNKKPCGKCADCESIKEYDNILKDNTATKRFFASGFNTHDKEFQRLFMEEPIWEMRVLLNNDCQLNCKHCYHNNNDLIGDILTDEELIRTIIDAYNLGIRSIHYAGKEPLYNGRIFKITNTLRTLGYNDIDFSVVTNGINVTKYAKEIKSSGISKVFLSSGDEFAEIKGIRPDNINKIIKKAVEVLNDLEIPVEIFYDLTPDNIGHTISNLNFWYEKYKVKNFHIRTLRNVGGAEKFPLLDIKDICTLHNNLTKLNIKANIEFNIGACPYTYDLLMSDEPYTDEIKHCAEFIGSTGNNKITSYYSLFPELYCGRYQGQITLTADGFILGCAMECSVKNYDKISAGNVREKSLQDIILKGKKQSLSVNEAQITEDIIYFQNCAFTPLDI